MSTHKINGREITLPYIFPRGKGQVRLYGDPPLDPVRFHLKYQTGRNTEGTITYAKLTFSKLTDAFDKGKEKVDLLDSDQVPKDSASWQSTQGDAALYRSCTESLKTTGFTVVTACGLVVDLVNYLGPEGINTFAHVYGPRLKKITPTFAEIISSNFRKEIFKNKAYKDLTPHQKCQSICLDTFEAKFKGRFISLISVEDIQIFIDTNKPNDDSYNKYLYTLRPLFRFARDIKKALPALLPTECDLLVYHKPGKVDKKVFTVEAYGKLLNAAPDKETLLALKLVFRHHVREDECADLLGEDFRKNEKGFPIELIIREEVSKTGIVRKIPIDEDHRAVLKELIPDSGRLFTTKDPYFRVRQLAKRIGIPWVNRGPRRSCTSYCVYSGIDIVKVAERNGHTETVLRNRYLVAVSHSQSKLFCSIRISLDKIKRLPSHFNGRNNSRKRKAKKVAPAPAILAA